MINKFVFNLSQALPLLWFYFKINNVNRKEKYLNINKSLQVCMLGITQPQSSLVLKWFYLNFSVYAANVYITLHISKVKTIF